MAASIEFDAVVNFTRVARVKAAPDAHFQVGVGAATKEAYDQGQGAAEELPAGAARRGDAEGAEEGR